MKYRAWIAFIVLGLVWGGSFLFIKIIGRDLTPFTLVAARLGLATLGLWVLALILRVRFPQDRREILGLVLLGAIKNTIPFIMITVGQQWIDSGVSSILNSSTPLFTLIVAHFALQDEHITWRNGLGLLIGFGGILVISSRSVAGLEIADWHALAGHLLVIGAAGFYGLAAVASRKYFRQTEPIVQSVVTITAAFTFALIVALSFETPISLVMKPEAVVSLLILGLAGTALANYLYFYVIRAWGATRASLVTYVLPVIGLTLGVLILNEPLDWRLFAGFAMVLTAIYIVSSKKAAPQPVTLPAEQAPEPSR